MNIQPHVSVPFGGSKRPYKLRKYVGEVKGPTEAPIFKKGSVTVGVLNERSFERASCFKNFDRKTLPAGPPVLAPLGGAVPGKTRF